MMNQAFFDKYKVELKEIDALHHILKAAKKLIKLCEKEEDYTAELAEFDMMVDDFKEAKS